MHALHEAAQVGDLQRVKSLLSQSPELVFRSDWNQDTALHLAAYFGYGDIVELLLAHRADPNATNSHGKTPLHRAAFNGHKEVARVLLRHGATIDAKDNYGDTPMHEAMVYGYNELAVLLREFGGKD